MLLELDWADIAKCRVVPRAHVEPLNVVEHLGLVIGPRAVDLAVGALDLPGPRPAAGGCRCVAKLVRCLR